mgnify:CR=1 FL=1
MESTSAGERQQIVADKLPSRVLNNNVLVRIDFDPSEDVIRPSGIILSGQAGVKWQEASYVARYGVVVDIPDKLLVRPTSNFEGAMSHTTSMELKKGDVVYFTKMGSANAPALNVDGITYFLINYSEIILRVRDEVITPINGYCIVEKVIEKATTVSKTLTVSIGDKQNKRRGVVRFVGKKNKSYFGTDAIDADVEVGDNVIFQGGFWTALEDSLFETLGKDLGFVQMCWISGKFVT